LPDSSDDEDDGDDDEKDKVEEERPTKLGRPKGNQDKKYAWELKN